jgi:hypothetical protein
MTVKLREFGSSFATRQRARDVTRLLSDLPAEEVDVSDVLCSPSFLAEFLQTLTETRDVTITTDDAAMASKLRRLATQLMLTDKVQVRPVVSV